MNNRELIRKKNFDDQVDDLYSNFLDLIDEYERELNKSKALDGNLKRIAEKQIESNEKFNKIKDEKIKEIGRMESQINSITSPEDERAKELNKKVANEIQKSVELVKIIEEKKSELHFLEEKKTQLITFEVKNNELNSNSNCFEVSSPTSIANGKFNYSPMSPHFQDSSLDELRSYKDGLKRKLEELNSEFKGVNNAGKMMKNEMISKRISNKEDERALKPLVKDCNDFVKEGRMVQKQARMMEDGLVKSQKDIENKSRMIEVLEEKNRLLMRVLKEEKTKLLNYDAIVGENLELKREIQILERGSIM